MIDSTLKRTPAKKEKIFLQPTLQGGGSASHPGRRACFVSLPVLLLLLAVFLPALAAPLPCRAGVSMETDGRVMSIDRQDNQPSSEGERFGTPPRNSDPARQNEETELPWGIVPEVYVPWHLGNPGHGPGKPPGIHRPPSWQGRPPYPGMTRPPYPSPRSEKHKAPHEYGRFKDSGHRHWGASGTAGAGVPRFGGSTGRPGAGPGMNPGERSGPPGLPQPREYIPPASSGPGERQLYPGQRQPLPGNTPQPVYPGEKPPQQGPRQNRPPL